MKNPFFKLIAATLLFLIYSNSFAQCEADWQWTKAIHGDQEDLPENMAADAFGNVYVVGYFMSPSITFGTVTLYNKGSRDMFIVKYNSECIVEWAKSAGGGYWDYATSITIDDLGNIYVTGDFESKNISFGSITLTNSRERWSEVFLVKYNTDGKALWARSGGGTHQDFSGDVTIDDSGNAYVVGYYGSDTFHFGSQYLYNIKSPSWNVFILKYDSIGNELWCLNEDGGGHTCGSGVVVDQTGNIYIIGFFQKDSEIYDQHITSRTGYNMMFFAKYDKNKNLMWAKRPDNNYAEVPQDIKIDKFGNLYIIGHYGSYNKVYFDSVSLGSTTGERDLFIVKHDPTGNAIWASSAYGSNNEEGNRIDIDSLGNVYITGRFFSDILVFGVDTLSRIYMEDTYLAKFDKEGKVVWAKSAGAMGTDNPKGIVIDKENNIWICGFFKSGPFYIGHDTFYTNHPMDKVFIAKLSNNFEIGHNKSDIKCHGENNGATELTIQCGKEPYNISWSNGKTSKDLNNLTPGTYIATVTDSNNCFQTDTVIIYEPPALAIDVIVQDDSSEIGKGYAEAIVNGGTPPYK